MLAGMGGAGFVSGSAVSLTPTVLVGSGEGITIPAPVAGHVCVILNAALGNSSGGTPSGFTLRESESSSAFGTEVNMRLSTKTLTGSETEVDGLEVNNSNHYMKWIAITFPTTAFTTTAWSGTDAFTSGNPTLQDVDSSGLSGQIISVGLAMGDFGSSLTLSFGGSFTEVSGGVSNPFTFKGFYSTGAGARSVDTGDSGDYTGLASGFLRLT